MGRRKESTEFLKECMADALLCLMNEKPFAKITADEISVRAGVGRATWFRHFSSKEDALAYKVRVLWHHWSEQEGLKVRTRFYSENGLSFFRFFIENRQVFETIYNAEMRHVVYAAFQQIMSSQEDGASQARYATRFFTGGLFGLVDMWICGGFRETPSEMNRITHDALLARR